MRGGLRFMLPRALVVAGRHSGVGKTTISIALMAALRRRGLRVQPFKVGPDFIDPTLHTRAAGCVSRNVESWMLSEETNAAVFAEASQRADIAVIEGVMGLFDGRDALTEAGSTAEMAKLLGVPVVLIIDASAMARSAAALVRGYESFDEALDVAGVIFNRVAGPGHFSYLRDAVEARCRARVLGWLPADESIRMPERHLGLVMADEVLDEARLDALATWLEKGLDVNALVDLARQRSRAPVHRTETDSPSFVQIGDAQESSDTSSGTEKNERAEHVAMRRQPRIGVARDRAFCFYYQDNLDLLASFGAHIVDFSPISDPLLPDLLDGLYFAGGYPELNATALAANETMRADVARFVRSGKPVYAECGGLMYLTEAIIDADGESRPMVGIFPTRARMQRHLAAIGYAEVEGLDDEGWLRADEQARGHEFRYSLIDERPEQILRRCRVITKAGERKEGFPVGLLLGGSEHSI